jgi:hypothetical protein
VIQTVGNVVKLEVRKIATSIHLWNGHWFLIAENEIVSRIWFPLFKIQHEFN